MLPEGYSTLENPQIANTDPFSCLNNIFRFSAFGYVQFLNIIETKIGLEIGYKSLDLENHTLTNLLYFQQLLDDHVLRLQKMIAVIQSYASKHLLEYADNHMHPKKTKDAAVAASTTTLLQDIEHLHQRSIMLSDRCTRGTKILMNNATVLEAKQNFRQAKWIGKLTLTAFFYIPLSFMTSFFGMNFRELGGPTGSLSIWVWFVSSTPIFIISILVLFWDSHLGLRTREEIRRLRRLRDRSKMPPRFGAKEVQLDWEGHVHQFTTIQAFNWAVRIAFNYPVGYGSTMDLKSQTRRRIATGTLNLVVFYAVSTSRRSGKKYFQL